MPPRRAARRMNSVTAAPCGWRLPARSKSRCVGPLHACMCATFIRSMTTRPLFALPTAAYSAVQLIWKASRPVCVACRRAPAAPAWCAACACHPKEKSPLCGLMESPWRLLPGSVSARVGWRVFTHSHATLQVVPTIFLPEKGLMMPKNRARAPAPI